MRHHKDTTKCPKRKTTQAQKTPTTPTAATSTGALHPIWGAAPEQKRCIAYGSGAVPQQTRTNAELTRPIHSPPHPSMHGWALPVAGRARRPRHHLHSGPLQHLPHPYMRRAGFRPQLHPNYEEPLFGKAVGHSRQRRLRRPTRMMETSSCWDRNPILLRSGGVVGPAKARSWIG